MKKRQLSLNDKQEKHLVDESERLNISVNAVVVTLINKDIERKESDN